MIVGVQAIAILFGLFMTYLTYIQFRKRNLQTYDVIVWFVVWIIFILAATFPSTLTIFLQPLVIQNVIDLLTIGAFMMMFSIVFKLYISTKKNEKNIKTIVRKIALK